MTERKAALQSDPEFWRRARRHVIVGVPLTGFVLSFLYGVGFVDIPASRGAVSALETRIVRLEVEQGNVSTGLQALKHDSSAQTQKLDDVKSNVDRLVGALIDGGLGSRPKSNYVGKNR